MRLFLAVDLDEPTRAIAAGAARTLAAHLDRARTNADLSWAAPEKLHLTLRFLGEVDDGQVDDLRVALAPALLTGGFVAGLAGAGAFPASGPPRVIWLGVKLGVTELAAVHREIEQRLVSVGFPAEGRPFTPHLTLARLRRPCSRSSGDAIRRLLQEADLDARWHVDRVTLYESQLSPRGATYVPLAYTPLAGHATIG
jgi:2'-5' RNA ligase